MKRCKVLLTTSCDLCTIQNQAQVLSEVLQIGLTFTWAKVHSSYNLGISWLFSPPRGGLPDQTAPSMTYRCVPSCWMGRVHVSWHVLPRGGGPPSQLVVLRGSHSSNFHPEVNLKSEWSAAKQWGHSLPLPVPQAISGSSVVLSAWCSTTWASKGDCLGAARWGKLINR